jgi:hypothetical protein
MRLDANKIPIAYREPFAFGRPCYVDERPPGESILDMVLSVPHLPARFVRDGIVCINGEVVPNELWAYVRPKPASAQLPIAVTLHQPLHGRGGGGGSTLKSVVGVVAALALIVVTAGIGAGFAAPILGASFAAGTVGASVLAGAVGIAGALAISALTAPPTVATPASTGGQDVTGNTDALEAASAQGNLIDRGGAIPRVIGTRKVFPPFACEPLVELVDQDEYIEALFVLNGPHALSDIKVDGFSIEEAEDIEFDTREGWSSDTPIELVSRQARTLQPNIELSVHSVDDGGVDLLHQSLPENDLPVWHGVVARPNADEIWLHFLFPGGIQNAASSAAWAVPLRIRFRRLEGGSPTSDWVNLPELHVARASILQFRTAILFKWQDAEPIPTVPVDSGFVYASIDVPPQTAGPTTPTDLEWNANAYFDDGAGDVYLQNGNESSTRVRRVALFENRVEIYMLEASFSKTATYEFQIKRGNAFSRAAFTGSTYVYGAGIRDFFYYFGTAPAQVVEGRINISDRCILSRVISIWDEHPIQSPDFALIAVKTLNRSIRSVSVVASGYVQDWGGSAWDTWTTTSNPAPHYADVLCGAQNLDPLPADLRDDTGLVAWRTTCSSLGWTCDAIVSDMRTQDVLSLLASCGYARPYQSDVYGVTVDDDRSADTPVQIFSRRNSNNMRFEKSFARVPAGLTVTYRDEQLDDDQAQITVYQSDPTNSDLSLLENIAYDGLTTAAKATARAQFDLDQANLRSTFYYIDTDVESIVCQRGSLIGVEHDVLSNYAGDGYIVSKQTSAGNITGVTLDAEIPITTEDDMHAETDLHGVTDMHTVGCTTGIVIRRTDATLSTHTLSNVTGETSVLTFATPFADVATIQGFTDNDRKYGCLVVAGRVGSVYRRLLVQSILPNKDLTASLVLVDEAPELVRYGE